MAFQLSSALSVDLNVAVAAWNGLFFCAVLRKQMWFALFVLFVNNALVRSFGNAPLFLESTGIGKTIFVPIFVVVAFARVAADGRSRGRGRR